MLKKDLIREVAILVDEEETLVRRVLESTTTAVLTALAGGASVMLLGLGKLNVARRGAKKARDMVTGEVVIVPPRNVVRLRPSVGVHEAINKD